MVRSTTISVSGDGFLLFCAAAKCKSFFVKQQTLEDSGPEPVDHWIDATVIVHLTVTLIKITL